MCFSAGTPYSPGQLCRSQASSRAEDSVLSPLVVQPPSARHVMPSPHTTPSGAPQAGLLPAATPVTPFGPVSLMTPHADLPHMRAVSLFGKEPPASARRPLGLPPRTPHRASATRGAGHTRDAGTPGTSFPGPSPPSSAASSIGMRGESVSLRLLASQRVANPLGHCVSYVVCSDASPHTTAAHGVHTPALKGSGPP